MHSWRAMPVSSSSRYLDAPHSNLTLIIQKSLFEDAQGSESDEIAVERRKSKIGQECRQQLLEYFINGSTASTMKRWVSDLLVQKVSC
jgi:hypothetical protein